VIPAIMLVIPNERMCRNTFNFFLKKCKNCMLNREIGLLKQHFNLALEFFWVCFLSYRMIKHCLPSIGAYGICWLMNGRFFLLLSLTLLTWKIGWAPNNASRWEMGFNSVFKELRANVDIILLLYPFNSLYIAQHSVFGNKLCSRVVRGSNDLL
jgi:hypothetical protein